MVTDNGPGLRSPIGSASPPYSRGPYEFSEPIAFQKQLLGYERKYLVEYFKKKPGINADMTFDDLADDAGLLAALVIVNRDFEIASTTGASTDDVTFSSTEAGILLTTDSVASRQLVIQPHTNTGQTGWTDFKWGTENQVVWEAIVRTGSSIADIVIWLGLKESASSTVTGDADAVFFRFDAGVTFWETQYSIGGNDSTTSTNVTVVASTTYYFRIEIDGDRIAHYFIDNKEVGVSTALTDDKDFEPYIGVEGNAKTLTIVATAISRVIFE